jgi:UDP-N-acetylglucosamine:LPS N-acetylglucosamine transferase
MLLFYSKTGGGHRSLGEALSDMLSSRFSIDMIDPQPGIIHFHYRMVSRYALWLWGLEYRYSNRPAQARSAHEYFSRLMKPRLLKILTEAQPDLIISTYPFLTCEIACALCDLRIKIPLVLLQADPSNLHQSWLTERSAEAVLSPTQETYTQSLAAGYSPERLHLSGWPVREQFYNVPMDANPEKLVKLGLKRERFTIFLQGGGEGATRFVQTIENILAIKDVQLILAAGTNQRLLQHFSGNDRILALPFTREIAPYMALADVVMGKAGPNMLFEAGTLGKPFIVTSYIPGQEQPNIEFIKSHRLGWIALDAEKQRSLVESLVTDPSQMDGTKESVAGYHEWNSNRVKLIPSLMSELLQR